jgi:hypothetical protein
VFNPTNQLGNSVSLATSILNITFQSKSKGCINTSNDIDDVPDPTRPANGTAINQIVSVSRSPSSKLLVGGESGR